jgi:hypothetical protein
MAKSVDTSTTPGRRFVQQTDLARGGRRFSTVFLFVEESDFDFRFLQRFFMGKGVEPAVEPGAALRERVFLCPVPHLKIDLRPVGARAWTLTISPAAQGHVPPPAATG